MSHYITSQSIKQLLSEFAFADVGVAPLEKPLTFDYYKSWINEGLNGSMSYLVDHMPFKESPKKLSPMANSAIVVLEKYWPHPWPHHQTDPLSHCRVASYAKGEDYHLHFKSKLQSVANKLQEEYPSSQFLCYTDSSPVLERDLAYKAQLGWFGKNTCLLNRTHGSLFFIGEIYTNLLTNNHSADTVPHNHCGSCTKCIEVCPTQAIIEDKKIDASRCISYLTIESRKLPPAELRTQMGDWLFGCDLCQTVCPWNQKNYSITNTDVSHSLATSGEEIAQLRWILKSSNNHLQKTFKNTPFSRAGGFGLKRNAILVAANKNYMELYDDISKYLTHEKLGELAHSALLQIHSKD